MIPAKYKGSDLIGKRCRPVSKLKNRGGAGITPATICIIKKVVPGHGFVIESEPCPCCGQYAYMTHVARNELELIGEDEL